MDNYIYLLIIVITVVLGYSFRFLTISGSIAAALVGILTMLGLHIQGLFLLGVFFVTSSCWSKYKRMQKNKVEERHAKGSQRDWQQVIANGGGAAVVSLIYYFSPEPVWIYLFSIFIASSNSDTWASEIGTLSKKAPISIRTLSIAENGTSGAMSMLGTFAGVSGALLIALLAFFLFDLSYDLAILIFIFGFLGNIVDTILGAFFQASYQCTQCHSETEKTIHCGYKTKRTRGFSFLNNDFVNFLSSLIAALVGFAVYTLSYV